MKTAISRKARQRLDERLGTLKPIERYTAPPKGWIRAIREALGMSGVQFASRLRVTPQSVDALERSEANGRVKLETLRRAAEALDCTLVYAFVPNKPLEQTIADRARAVAIRDLGRVAHSMKLEAQHTGDADLEERIEEYIRNHVSLRDLWSEG